MTSGLPGSLFRAYDIRGIYEDTLTLDNAERIGRAIGEAACEQQASPVAVGRDGRLSGPDLLDALVRGIQAAGADVADIGVVPTPALYFATHELPGVCSGVMVTGSHNPPEYNGFKIKANFGGPAPPPMIAAVEKAIPPASGLPDPLSPFDDLTSGGRVALHDVRSGYLNALHETLNIDAITAGDFTIAHDAMYGAGQGLVTELLGEDQVIPLRHDLNPGFHGVAPEPIADRLHALSDTVASDPDCAVGLANDGDADRIGMMDENGDFVSSHRLLALLVKYLYEERGLSGSVVKTFSTTHMLDRMAERYGLAVDTTPIGFKHIAPKMAEGGVLVGGEESGGIAAAGHIPERDGIYIGLLIVEMMVERGKPLSALVDELLEEFGPHYNYRDDIHIREDQKADVLDRLANKGGLATVNGHEVTEVQTLDGFKHITDHGWLLIRPSGTEPVLRVYSEAESPADAEALVKDASHQLGLDN